MAEPVEGARVSTLELFFDLVFVFTITQLTAVLADELSWAVVARVALILSLLMWMYGGYAWLTNAISPNSPARRTLMLVGMSGFLAISLAIPEAFGTSGKASRIKVIPMSEMAKRYASGALDPAASRARAA